MGRLGWGPQPHKAPCRALDLARNDGRRTSASVKVYIFCGKKIQSGYLHCLGECAVSASDALPSEWVDLGLRERTLAFLRSVPGDSQFEAVAAISRKMEKGCAKFWVR